MEILNVDVVDPDYDDTSENFELIFHLSDGNTYHVDAKCLDYMTEEDREWALQNKQEEDKWYAFEEKEDYREAYWKRQGYKGFVRKKNPHEETE